MMSKPYLFVDFEFTMPEDHQKRKGFVPEIIEAGVAVVRNGEVHDTFSSFVKPEINSLLSNRCMQFLDITQEAVDQGISFRELIAAFMKYESQCMSTVVTWGNMDMYVLRKQCLQAGIPYPFPNKEIDLSMEHKRFYGTKNQTGLMKALVEFGHSAKGKHHRALDDAMTTFEIFKLMEKDKKYLKRAEPSTIGELVDFSRLLAHMA
ncbi:3'-5' exonuclease KapD [Brevibacillus nitrificans]|uniref:3'-5' exonuclease KapD n=1 Tax=Brevibacillus nitrificans TaxID=651560 RepID=A0A3M8D4J7_9BACL|nr:3'-5' exonuclease KapD [Brevibacillus nitrificans]RNB82511.1 3'-5' exonuclease KapD [Brevibacillus nitrificans]